MALVLLVEDEQLLRWGVKKRLTSHGHKVDEAPNLAEAEKLVETVNGFLSELEDLGCHYKDWNFEIGLVDFPAIIDDEEVLLCWRSDEDELMYYHSVEGGYAGRTRIPEQLLTPSSS